MACTISGFEYQSSSKRPVLVSYQNGIIMDSKEDELDYNLLKRNDTTTVISASKTMLYKADIIDGDTNKFIAIVNRKTNKIRFIAIDDACFAPVTAPVHLNNKVDILKSKNYNASTILINKTFGSKKAQRAGERMERLHQEVSNVKENLEKTVKEMKIVETDLATGDLVGSLNPPLNHEAKNPEEVYEIHKLVDKDILDILKNDAKRLFKCTPDGVLLSDYAIKLHTNIKNSDSSKKEKIKKIKILILVDTLIRLANLNANLVSQKSFKICHLSDRVNDYVLDNFTSKTNKRRTRPMSMKDKTICYVIIFILIINNYSVNIPELSHIFALGSKKTQDLCRILSLTLNKNKVNAELLLPLPKNAVIPRIVKKRKLQS